MCKFVYRLTRPRIPIWRFSGRGIGAVGREWVWWRAREGPFSLVGRQKGTHSRVRVLFGPKNSTGVSGEAKECSEACISLRSARRIASAVELSELDTSQKTCKTVPRSALLRIIRPSGAAMDGGNRAVAKNRGDEVAASRRGMTRS